jgi:hypothetical protein
MDVVDADDYVIGEAPAPIAVVTDNGPCFRGVTFADAFAGDDPLFRHVRTRVRSHRPCVLTAVVVDSPAGG